MCPNVPNVVNMLRFIRDMRSGICDLSSAIGFSMVSGGEPAFEDSGYG